MSPVQTLIAQFAIGLGVGGLSGLLGIGGGIVLVPAMVFLLGVDQHVAQGVSLAVIVPTALVGATTHYRHGNVLPRLGVVLGVTAIGGALIGAWLAGMLEGDTLRRAFGVFLVAVAARMLVTELRARR